MWKNPIVDLEYVKNVRFYNGVREKCLQKFSDCKKTQWEFELASSLIGFSLEPSMIPKDSASLLPAMSVSSWETGIVMVLIELDGSHVPLFFSVSIKCSRFPLVINLVASMNLFGLFFPRLLPIFLSTQLLT